MKFIKKNGKYIGIVMICVFCSYLTTIATNYIFDSSDVRFDNTGTSLESVNVQDAIDETFHHVTDYNEIKTTIGNNALTTTNQTLIGGINELNSNLGLPSSASGITGADAFSKINTLNSNMTSLVNKVSSNVYYGNIDANAYTTFGFYHVGISTHSPGGVTRYGMLCVFTGGNGFVAQFFIETNNQLYFRYKNSTSSEWLGWQVVTSASV